MSKAGSMLIAELLRGVASIAFAPNDLSAGGSDEGAGAGAAGEGGAAKAGADSGAGEGQDGAGAAAEGKGAEGGEKTSGIGSNSGKTVDEVMADLALTDELRSKLINGLPKEAHERAGKYLKTRSSITDLFKAGLGADSKISELTAAQKGMIKVPGKDAKPEEVAAYRKAMGVPEAPDKYAVYRPEGFEPTDADTEIE